jgi:hypothetical protein
MATLNDVADKFALDQIFSERDLSWSFNKIYEFLMSDIDDDDLSRFWSLFCLWEPYETWEFAPQFVANNLYDTRGAFMAYFRMVDEIDG